MYLILNLMYLFCALNLSSEQYIAKPLSGNDTSLLVTKPSISENNEEFQMIPAKKNKVKKRPGVPVYPAPSIVQNDKYDIEQLKEEEDEDAEHRNLSSTVPRKGAGVPPPLNAINPTSNSTNSTNFAGENKNDTEMMDHLDEDFTNTNNNASTIKNDNNSKAENEAADEHTELNAQQINDSRVVVNKNDSQIKIEPKDTSTINVLQSNADKTNVSILFTSIQSNSVTPSLQSDMGNALLSSRKPSIASMKDSANTTSTTAIIAAIVIVVLVCSLLGYITYKRLFAYWNRRHYSRVDFLIDGLYEM